MPTPKKSEAAEKIPYGQGTGESKGKGLHTIPEMGHEGPLSLKEAKAAAIRVGHEVEGQHFLVDELLLVVRGDTKHLNFGQMVEVVVDTGLREEDLARVCDTHVDPYWDVTISEGDRARVLSEVSGGKPLGVEDIEGIMGQGSAWVYGPSYKIAEADADGVPSAKDLMGYRESSSNLEDLKRFVENLRSLLQATGTEISKEALKGSEALYIDSKPFLVTEATGEAVEVNVFFDSGFEGDNNEYEIVVRAEGPDTEKAVAERSLVRSTS